MLCMRNFDLGPYSVFLSGFFLSLSLILAIGPQNSFIIRQGLKREYVFSICLVCALSDVILILLGVFGVSIITGVLPKVLFWAKCFGSAFLLLYGLKHFHSVFFVNADITLKSPLGISFKNTILTCLALTWLNPHVYLDTVLLIGSVAAQYDEQRIYFALGSIFAVTTFFFSLGYGASLLRPLFQNSRAWKYLDFFIGCIMVYISYDIWSM